MTTKSKDIKPIETRYSGYRFRSRLEARWGVFFNAMGMKWTYEPEGFHLSDGTLYLPDFFLPELECWVEVKPFKPSVPEVKKCEQLAEEGHAVVLVWGLPDENAMLVYCSDLTDGSGGIDWWDTCHWSVSLDGELCIDSGNDRRDRTFWGGNFDQSFRGMKLSGDVAQDLMPVIEAGGRAREARWGRGEQPR